MTDTTALSNIAEIVMGTSPAGDTYNQKDDGLPLLNGPAQFGSIYPECDKYTTDSKRECKDGDLIFCVRGSTTGRMNWADRVYSLGRGVCAIRGASDLDTKYIRYCIEDGLRSLLKIAGGGTFPNLTKKDIHSFEIPYPSNRLEVASVLSTYDDLIAKNAQRIELLEAMAQAVYREWFVEMRFPSHDDAEMRETEALGAVPAGWEVARLGDLAESPRNRVKPQEEVEPDVPYFGLGDLPKKSIALSEWGRAEDAGSTKYTFNRGDILFGKIRPYFHKVGPAPVAGICSTDAIVIRPFEAEHFGLVLGYVSSEEFVAHATQTSSGTKMPRAKWKILKDYPVAVPPTPVLGRFNDTMRGFVNQIHTLIHKNRTLRRTRDLLLPRLVSGEVAVEEAEEGPREVKATV